MSRSGRKRTCARVETSFSDHKRLKRIPFGPRRGNALGVWVAALLHARPPSVLLGLLGPPGTLLRLAGGSLRVPHAIWTLPGAPLGHGRTRLASRSASGGATTTRIGGYEAPAAPRCCTMKPPMEMNEAEAEAIVAQVDAIYSEGPPPRTTVPVVVSGVTLFLVNGLFLECSTCGTRVPQSRSRQSPPARALWLRFHLRCVRP